MKKFLESVLYSMEVENVTLAGYNILYPKRTILRYHRSYIFIPQGMVGHGIKGEATYSFCLGISVRKKKKIRNSPTST